MHMPGQSTGSASKQHPYLAGNFAPITQSWPPTTVTWEGEIPEELRGGMYVRNGGNATTNSDLGREAHWFDGDGMLSGVWFDVSQTDMKHPVVKFVNQFIFTDVYLSAMENNHLRTPILPSISTLVNPASALLWIVWRIIRSVLLVILSNVLDSQQPIRRISVANTGIHFHDGRALATCESGPPMRVTLPDLDTVGWFDGNGIVGEDIIANTQDAEEHLHGFGGAGPLSWMREWTTGHPKVDSVTDELVLFHCNFTAPFVHYSLIPANSSQTGGPKMEVEKLMSVPVPGCSGGKLMHDFGVSRCHTVILDLPLTLSPLNLLRGKPVLSYEAKNPSRFGVFPRKQPAMVRWFETSSCCVFHVANTWDEQGIDGKVVAVNMLVCRLTSASLVFSAGNIVPPPHPGYVHREHRSTPISFFAKYDEEDIARDPEKLAVSEASPLLDGMCYGGDTEDIAKRQIPGIPISLDEEEQCRLYYYRFLLNSTPSNTISHQFALSVIPFEFPTVSPLTDMEHARYIYGCSTAIESFGAALGKATKIDVLVRMDVKELLALAEGSKPKDITGCIDNRTLDEISASEDPFDPIKIFRLPPGWFAQEARFVPRKNQKKLRNNRDLFVEDDGYLLFYVFNEDQLDEAGNCQVNAKSEMWVLNARNMHDVVCKIHLPTRIPYGLHGNWFTGEQIASQRRAATTRSLPSPDETTKWSRMRRSLVQLLR